MPNGRPTNRATDVMITALAPMLWGTTYYTTSELLPDGRPLLAGLLRSLPAGLLLATFGRRVPHGDWWWKSLVLGALNIGVFFPLLFLGAYRLPGGVAASIGAIQPVVAAGLAAVLIGERFSSVNVVCGVLGATGVALLVLRNQVPLDAVGIGAALAAALSMATGVVLTKKWGRPVPLLAFTSWQLIAGGLVLLPTTLVFEGLPSHLSASNVAGYAWLALAGAALAYAVWFRGIGRLPIAATTVLGLLTPVVAALIGWMVLDQSLRPLQIVGIAAILASVLIMQWWSARRAPRAAAAANPPVVAVHALTGR